MKTAAEYRTMAEECFKWASEARTDTVRASYRQLAQIWLNTASKLDGLPPTRAMIDGYDQYYGEGSGEAFFMGPYLDALPKLVIEAGKKAAAP